MFLKIGLTYVAQSDKHLDMPLNGTDANGRVKINVRNTVCDINFNTIYFNRKVLGKFVSTQRRHSMLA